MHLPYLFLRFVSIRLKLPTFSKPAFRAERCMTLKRFVHRDPIKSRALSNLRYFSSTTDAKL